MAAIDGGLRLWFRLDHGFDGLFGCYGLRRGSRGLLSFPRAALPPIYGGDTGEGQGIQALGPLTQCLERRWPLGFR